MVCKNTSEVTKDPIAKGIKIANKSREIREFLNMFYLFKPL